MAVSKTNPDCVGTVDLKTAGICSDGLRDGCNHYDIDMKKLVLGGGIPFADLAHIDDANIQRCIDAAKARQAENE